MLEQPLLFNDIASTLSFNSSDFSEHSQSGQICTLKRYIFKIALPPPALPTPKKKITLNKNTFFKIPPSENTFSKITFSKCFSQKI